MNKEIAIKENYSIAKIKDMTAMANVLKAHIVKNKLYTNISGKNYAHVEGWQFAGGLMGLFPRVSGVENLSSGTELKWKSNTEIIDIKTDKVVGNGFALCSNKESKKAKFDEYAVLSMAQTRSIGKAYRNLIGWVMKLAGYESTPSEEMSKVGEHETPNVEFSLDPFIKKLNEAKTVDELKKVWSSIPPKAKKDLETLKEEIKLKINYENA